MLFHRPTLWISLGLFALALAVFSPALRQHRAGNILISGPTPDRSLGIMLFRGDSQADVEALLGTEPWIAAGERTVEVIPWDVHELLGMDLLHGSG